MIIRGEPPTRTPLRSSGVFVVRHLSHGRTVYAKWPVKRRGPLPLVTLSQVTAWDQAQLMVKYPDAGEYIDSLNATRGTAFYARDQLLMAMWGHSISWPGYGWREAELATIQQLLDSICMTEGAVLYRGPDGWVCLDPGSEDQVLTIDPTTGLPVWADAGGGGGGSITVSDGSTTLTGVTELLFDGATIADLGGGIAQVTIGGDEDVAKLATVTLTAAQILAANVTPIEVVPAPGAGFVNLLLRAAYSYSYGSTSYTGGSFSALYFDPLGEEDQADNGDQGILSAGSSSFTGSSTNSADFYDDLTYFENAAISFFTTGAAWAGGDGTLKISAIYTVVPV